MHSCVCAYLTEPAGAVDTHDQCSQTTSEWDMIEAFEADITGGLQAATDGLLNFVVACEEEQLLDEDTRAAYTSTSFAANGTQYCVLHER